METKELSLNEKERLIRERVSNYPAPATEEPWVIDIYDDYVIIESEGAYYRATYVMSEESVEVQARSEWEEVEKDWRIKRFKDRGIAIKSIDDDGAVLAGYEVVFGGKDLEGQRFLDDTDYGSLKNVPVYYDHGQVDKDGFQVKNSIGTRIKQETDKYGRWVELQIEKSREYATQVIKLAQDGRLGISTGAIGHLVEVLEGNIKTWIIAEDSLTATPMEPRTLGVEQLKNMGIVIPASATDAKPAEDALKGDKLKSAVSSDEAKEAKAVATKNNDEKESDMTIDVKDLGLAIAAGYKQLQAADAVDAEAVAAQKAKEAATFSLAEIVSLKSLVESDGSGGFQLKAPQVVKSAWLKDDHTGMKGFEHWARSGQENDYTKSNSVAWKTQWAAGATKATLAEGASATGGILVPDELLREIIAKRDEEAVPVRAGARVFQTSSDTFTAPAEDASMSDFAIVAEKGAIPPNEPSFAGPEIKIYKYAKEVRASDEVLADEATDLLGFLSNAYGRAWAGTYNGFSLIGTGTGQPQGVYVGGTAGITAAGATTVTAAEVMSLYFSLPGHYSDSSAWSTRHSSLGVIAGLTGTNFMFAGTPQGTATTVSPQLIGKPVFVSDKNAAMTTGLKSAIIGNWNFYGIAERSGLAVRRANEIYIKTGEVGFFATFRVGGAVLQAEAFRYLTQA